MTWSTEVQTSAEPVTPKDVIVGQGGHFLTFPLPQGRTIEEFRKSLSRLDLQSAIEYTRSMPTYFLLLTTVTAPTLL